MEIVLKSYMPVCQELYDKYNGQEGRDLDCAYMMQDEFIKCCKDLHIVDSGTNGKKVAYGAFHMSIVSELDEIVKATHLKMSIMEFLEALCRVIDQLEDVSKFRTIHKHWYLDELNPKLWRLDMKVEALIPNILDLLKETH